MVLAEFDWDYFFSHITRCLNSCPKDCQKDFWKCHGDCIPQSQPCEEECFPLTYKCGDKCVAKNKPCNGTCLGTSEINCNGTCINSFKEKTWLCGDKCIRYDEACDGQCTVKNIKLFFLFKMGRAKITQVNCSFLKNKVSWFNLLNDQVRTLQHRSI